MDIFSQLVVNSVIAGSLYALIAVGFNLIYSVTKFFNLAHGVVATVGAYTVFYMTRVLDMPLYVGVIVGIITASVTGFLFYSIVYIPLKNRGASNMVLLIASLGLFTATQAIIAILFNSQFKTLTQTLETTHEFFGAILTSTQLLIIVSAAAVTVLLGLLLRFTLLGKAIKAISDNEEVSKVVGINTARIIGYTFLIGSAIAGLGGIMIGLDTGIQPTMGLPLLLKGVIAAIVGGVGSVYGGFLGAILLGFVENFGVWQFSGEWKDAIAFALLILFLLVRPQGILKK